MILSRLLTQGFNGDVHAVNIKGEVILGKKSFKMIGEIPGAVDTAIIVTPRRRFGVIKECVAKG